MSQPLKYLSNCLENNIDEIKLSLLFTDKIEIYEDQTVIYTGSKELKPGDEIEIGDEFETGKDGYLKSRYITKEFKAQIQVLIEEGIISISKEYQIEKTKDKIWITIENEAKQIIKGNYKEIFFDGEIKDYIKDGKSKPAYLINKEVQEILNKIESNFGFILHYYRRLLTFMIRDSFMGNQCLSSSNVLNKLLKLYYSQKNRDKKSQSFLNENNLNPQIAFNVLKLNFPTITKLSFYDILEIREKSKAEIERFSFELQRMQFELQNDYSLENITSHAEEIVKFKVQPAINEFANKLNASDFKFIKALLSELKDPKSYTPLLTTVFGNIPNHIALLCSAGLISTSVLLDLIEQKKKQNEIKQNGYYFLFDLKRTYA